MSTQSSSSGDGCSHDHEFPPDAGRGHDRLHLTRTEFNNNDYGINSLVEWFCRVCHARVTVTPDMLEVGHLPACPRRDSSLPYNGTVGGRVARSCPRCGQEGGEHLDACPKDGWTCPECEDDGFVSQKGLRSHYAQVHGESLRTRKCQNCQAMFAPGEGSQKYCSQECYHEGREKTVTRGCEWCGETFDTIPSRNRRFCSFECSQIGTGRERRSGEERECEYCGDTFYRRPADSGPYCSPECFHANRGSTSDGDAA